MALPTLFNPNSWLHIHFLWFSHLKEYGYHRLKGIVVHAPLGFIMVLHKQDSRWHNLGHPLVQKTNNSLGLYKNSLWKISDEFQRLLLVKIELHLQNHLVKPSQINSRAVQKPWKPSMGEKRGEEGKHVDKEPCPASACLAEQGLTYKTYFCFFFSTLLLSCSIFVKFEII